MDGDVTVRVEWSTLNYKDGLAVTGKAPVVRRFPMIAGIDFAGTVEASSHPDWKPGDQVILNGWGCGETHLGGYGEKARVKGDWLVRLPAGMSARDAMAIGTAGYTAMLAVMALERSRPHARGRSGRGDGSRRRRRLGRDCNSVASVAFRSQPRPGGRRRPTTCKNLGARRDHRTQGTRRTRRNRSQRSAGPAVSTPSVRRRWPMCCR